MQTKSDNPDVLSVGEVSTRLGYSVRHIHRLRKLGKFPGARRIEPNGHWRFPAHEVEALQPTKAVAS